MPRDLILIIESEKVRDAASMAAQKRRTDYGAQSRRYTTMAKKVGLNSSLAIRSSAHA